MQNNIDLTAVALHYSLLYLAVIIICGLFFAFGKTEGRQKKCCIIILSLIFFVIMAFRGENVGNDTDSYIAMFNVIASHSNPFDFTRNSAIETGFSIYCWLLSRIVNDARILFVVTAGFVTLSIARFAYKYVENIGMFFCLFIGTLYFDFFLSGLRNAMSIAVFLFAIEFLLERKAVPYFAICVISVLFHNSAIIYFFLYPLFSARTMAKKTGFLTSALLIVAAFLSGVFLRELLPYFLSAFPKYMYYVGGELLDGKTRFAAVLKMFVCLLLIVVPKLFRKPVPPQNVMLDNVGKRMAVLNLLAIFVAASFTAFMRIATLFHMYTLMQFSNEVGRMKPRSENKVWLVLLTLFAFYLYGLVIVVLKTPEWQTTYPIQLSGWIN